MTQKFVLDTNVLIDNPKIFSELEGCEVLIPMVVVSELDGLKKGPGELGHNARSAIRKLEGASQEGDLVEGVNVDGSLVFVFETAKYETNDDTIVECAIKYGATLISNDANVRLKARALGCEARESYAGGEWDTSQIFGGAARLMVGDVIIDAVYKDQAPKLENTEGRLANEFLILESETCPSKTAMVRYMSDGTLKKVPKSFPDLMEVGFKVCNKEQNFAADLLLDPEIDLVSLVGPSGTGKTMLAIAAGLTQTPCNIFKRSGGQFSRMIIIKTICSMGREIGFLPGSMIEKLSPLIGAIEDNIVSLLGGDKSYFDELVRDGVIELEAAAHIRGRSIQNAFILIDEAQNISKHELKTILTRAGKGSKIVLTGDIEQIDDKHLDHENNGLTHAITSFKGYSIAGHVVLSKGERSELATLASRIL